MEPKLDLTHDSSRPRCCVVCWRFCKQFVVNDSIKSGIQKMFDVQIDFEDRRVPLGICSSFRTGVYGFNRTGKNIKNLVLEHRTFDHIRIAPATRSDTVCTCKICIVAKEPVKAVTGAFKKVTGSVPKTLRPVPENPDPKNPEPTKYVLKKVPPAKHTYECGDCKSVIGKGKPHDCSITTLEENLDKFFEDHPHLAERMAAKTLRSKEPSPGGRIHLGLGAGGSKMAVAINAKPAHEKFQVSAEQLRKYSSEIGLGIGKQRDLGRQLNEWFGRGSVAPGFQKALRDMSNIVSGKCHVTHLEFKVDPLGH